MQAYEIQVYHNGRWEFDSYFNDRELVMSEAERMGGSGRYSGVRVPPLRVLTFWTSNCAPSTSASTCGSRWPN